MMPPKMVPRALVSLGIRMTRMAGWRPAVADSIAAGSRDADSGSLMRRFLATSASVNRDAAGEAFFVAVDVGDRLFRIAPAEVAVAVVPVDQPQPLDLAAEGDDA